MVESSPPGPRDPPDDAARFEGSDPAPEQAGQEVAAAKPYGFGGRREGPSASSRLTHRVGGRACLNRLHTTQQAA